MTPLMLSLWTQGTGEVTVNLTPAILLAAGGLFVVVLANVVSVVRMTSRMESKITEHDAHIISLRADRHDGKERLAVLEARARATDAEFERQRDEERDIRAAMAELIQQRRTA